MPSQSQVDRLRPGSPPVVAVPPRCGGLESSCQLKLYVVFERLSEAVEVLCVLQPVGTQAG